MERREENPDGLRRGAPGIAAFLERGKPISVSARTGSDLTGYVCDYDASGLLLDVRDGGGDATSYEYLPWSSIERVSSEE